MVAENIKRLREEKNLTQEALAEMVGCARCTIVQYERGSKVPNIMMARDIAIALECSVEDLLKNVE